MAGKKLNIIEVVEADAIARNEVFSKDILITFYNDTSKIKLADGKTAFNSLSYIKGNAKGDVGLGNVDNTSDVNKPVSTAQTTALNTKLTASKAATQADSVAVTLPAMVTDFNALLAKLKAAGIMT